MPGTHWVGASCERRTERRMQIDYQIARRRHLVGLSAGELVTTSLSSGLLISLASVFHRKPVIWLSAKRLPRDHEDLSEFHSIYQNQVFWYAHSQSPLTESAMSHLYSLTNFLETFGKKMIPSWKNYLNWSRIRRITPLLLRLWALFLGLHYYRKKRTTFLWNLPELCQDKRPRPYPLHFLQWLWYTD